MSQAESTEASTPLFNAQAARAIPAVFAVPHGGFFAHQGGWDEFLFVAAPLGVIGGLLWIANKRVSAQLDEANLASEADEPSGPTGRPDTR